MQNWKKRGMLLVILTNSGKDMTHKLKKKKKKSKHAYLGFIFIPEKYVFRVCFESPFTRMISSLRYKCPPPPGIFHKTADNKTYMPYNTWDGGMNEACVFVVVPNVLVVHCLRVLVKIGCFSLKMVY